MGDWFCESDLGFIFAPRGVGKTWFSIELAGAIAAGRIMGPWSPASAARVLYVDGEMPLDSIRDRTTGIGAANENLLILNHQVLFNESGRGLNIADPDSQAELTALCERLAVKALFLDNLSTLASGVAENDSDDWEKLKQWLLGLRRRGIAVVMIHHAGRNGLMRGTSRREDDTAWIISLADAKASSSDPRGARFVSTFIKVRNGQDHPAPLEWHYQTDLATGEVFRACKEPDDLARFRLLIQEGVVTCSEIAEEMGRSTGSVSKLYKKAHSAGWCRKSGREYELCGVYAEGNERE
jgi:putative DNA primase/helicase